MEIFFFFILFHSLFFYRSFGSLFFFFSVFIFSLLKKLFYVPRIIYTASLVDPSFSHIFFESSGTLKDEYLHFSFFIENLLGKVIMIYSRWKFEYKNFYSTKHEVCKIYWVMTWLSEMFDCQKITSSTFEQFKKKKTTLSSSKFFIPKRISWNSFKKSKRV